MARPCHEIGDKGSYAASMTQKWSGIWPPQTVAGRGRFNRLASVFTFYNFGAEVVPPVFSFVKDEDLQPARAKRDVDLYSIGWRPKKSYIAREYGIPEDDFDLASAKPAGFKRAASALIPEREHPEDCSCGCRDDGDERRPARRTRPVRRSHPVHKTKRTRAGERRPALRRLRESTMMAAQED